MAEALAARSRGVSRPIFRLSPVSGNRVVHRAAPGGVRLASQVTAGTSVAAIVMVPLAPLVGAWIDRWGARRVAIPGLILTMLAIASLALADGSNLQWLALWAVYGVAASTLNTTLWACVVLDTFKAGRSLAMSAVLSGATFAGAAAPPVTQWLTDSFGWQVAFVSLGLGWGGVALVLSLLCIPDRTFTARGSSAQSTTDQPGLSLREAARSVPLLRIGLATLIIMTLGSALGRPSRADTHGSRGVAGGGSTDCSAFRCHGGGRQARHGMGHAEMGCGHRRRTLDRRARCGAGSAARTAAKFGDDRRGHGHDRLRPVAPNYRSPPILASVYAGARNYGKIFGVMAGVMAVASGLGPVLGGIAFDATSDYSLLVSMGFPCCLLGAGLLMRLGARPVWDDRISIASRRA